MSKPTKDIALLKYKQMIQRYKIIKLEVPAENLKILLEIKYNLKLKLTDKNTIELL